MPPHLAATWKINDLPEGTAVLAPATIRDASRDYNAGDGRGGTGCCQMPSSPFGRFACACLPFEWCRSTSKPWTGCGSPPFLPLNEAAPWWIFCCHGGSAPRHRSDFRRCAFFTLNLRKVQPFLPASTGIPSHSHFYCSCPTFSSPLAGPVTARTSSPA